MGGRKLAPLAVALSILVLALAGGGSADHNDWECPQYGWQAGGDAVGVQSERPPTAWQWSRNDPALVSAGAVHVALDYLWGYYVFSFWIYAESNGVPGLQRHDDWCTTPGYGSEAPADTVIF